MSALQEVGMDGYRLMIAEVADIILRLPKLCQLSWMSSFFEVGMENKLNHWEVSDYEVGMMTSNHSYWKPSMAGRKVWIRPA